MLVFVQAGDWSDGDAAEAETGPPRVVARCLELNRSDGVRRAVGERDPAQPQGWGYLHLWVPNWSSTSCDQGVFVCEPIE